VGFTQYLRFSAGYAKLYGSIALVPLFLLWVYATWCIVLAGLNIAYYMQHGRRLKAIEPRDQINPGVVDPGCSIALAAALATRFENGEPSDPATLAGLINLQEGIVVQLLDRLVGAGIAQRVRKGDEEGYYSLARPADLIAADEALRAGEGIISQPDVGTVAQSMREARLAAVRGKTVASFMDRPVPPPVQKPAVPASA
jgi:membrane protein